MKYNLNSKAVANLCVWALIGFAAAEALELGNIMVLVYALMAYVLGHVLIAFLRPIFDVFRQDKCAHSWDYFPGHHAAWINQIPPNVVMPVVSVRLCPDCGRMEASNNGQFGPAVCRCWWKVIGVVAEPALFRIGSTLVRRLPGTLVVELPDYDLREYMRTAPRHVSIEIE
jgi:hypothetical protein